MKGCEYVEDGSKGLLAEICQIPHNAQKPNKSAAFETFHDSFVDPRSHKDVVEQGVEPFLAAEVAAGIRGRINARKDV
jgi:hypothetical protein